MLTFTSNLEKYIMNRYFINRLNTRIMIEDEYEYIEEYMIKPEGTIEDIAKELIEIYMAA